MATYTVDEVDYPSVTTVLGLIDKPGLRQWAANCAVDAMVAGADADTARKAFTEKSGDAMDIGSIVHRAIKFSCRYEKPLTWKPREKRSEVEKSYEAWQKWQAWYKPFFLSYEQTVVNKRKGYAGTLDAIARIDGVGLCVIDYKTSIYQSYEYGAQIAAYRYATDYACSIEMHGMLVNLDKESGDFKVKIYTPEEMRDMYEAFLGLLTYYYKSAKRRLKNNRRVK